MRRLLVNMAEVVVKTVLQFTHFFVTSGEKILNQFPIRNLVRAN